jgi:hypothetical protein
MRTRIHSILLAILATAALAAPADAKTKKKAPSKGKVVEKEAPKADAQALTALMGPYKWGMTIDLTLEALEIQLAKRYEDRLQKAANDKYAMNNLRKEIKAEVAKVRKSLTKFDGDKGAGWDVSIIEREFGQKNDEEMLISKEYDPEKGIDQQRFFFFVDGKLWKMFVSFDLDVFQGKGFAEFRQLMESRFGPAAAHELPRPDGGVDVDYVYWRGGGANLRAIDLTRFYGSFALAISDPKTEEWIFKRRAERNPLKAPVGTVVDSVMEDPNNKDPNLTQQNSDVVDRITKDKK